MSAYFITGTDTDVGKTVVATALLKHFNAKGYSTAAFKPIAAGCEQSGQGLRNADALSLQQNSSVPISYQEVNPFAFEPPIAPHIAADLVGRQITLAELSESYEKIRAYHSDITVVEGAGGWSLPINDSQFLYQWVAQEQLEVIIVVGIKLGCLNHALLTQAFIASQGLTIKGWVANIIAPETVYIDENIATLKHHIKAPLLATMPFVSAQQLDDMTLDFLI